MEPSGTSAIPASAGIGLRFPHHRAVVEERPAVGWLEVHSENYMGGGLPLTWLTKARALYPLSLHGVGLSLGSAEGIDRDHLARLKDLVGRLEPGLVSDHLSWSVVGGRYLADLLPLPMTEEALAVMCRTVMQAQEALGRPLLVENPSSYITFRHSTLSEPEFLSALVAKTGCGLLFDVNNLYVSCHNHGWDASAYLAALPGPAIGEIHLAGHAQRSVGEGTVLIDDHGSAVADAVWLLYAQAVRRFGPIPTLIEWDTDVPALEVLVGEANKAQGLLAPWDTAHA